MSYSATKFQSAPKMTEACQKQKGLPITEA